MGVSGHLPARARRGSRTLFRRLRAEAVRRRRDAVRVVRGLGRDDVLLMLKSGLAAALAWEIAERWTPTPAPFLAPLAAMLVVGSTVYRSFLQALQRVVATVVGVLLAYAIGLLVGVHWWSILLVVAGSRGLGRWHRFGQQGIQIPIAAILILTIASSHHGYAMARVIEILLGAAVGVAINALIAPPIHLGSARTALRDLAEEIATMLDDIARGLRGDWPPADAREWLRRALDLDPAVQSAEEAIDRAAESVRLNPHTVLDIGQVARRGWTGVRWPWRRPPQSGPPPPGPATASTDLHPTLRTLEHIARETRGIARTVFDAAQAPRGTPEDTGDRSGPHGPDRVFLDRYADLLVLAARADRRFAALRSTPDHEDPDADRRLRETVTEGLRIARELVRQLRFGGIGGDVPWPVYGSLLVEAERLLRELDPPQTPDHLP